MKLLNDKLDEVYKHINSKVEKYVSGLMAEKLLGVTEIVDIALVNLNKKTYEIKHEIRSEFSKEIGIIRGHATAADNHYESFFTKEESDTFVLSDGDYLIFEKGFCENRSRYPLLAEIYIDGARQAFHFSSLLDYDLKVDPIQKKIHVLFSEEIPVGSFVEIKLLKKV